MKEGEEPQPYNHEDLVKEFYSRLCRHLKENLKSTFGDRVMHINVSDYSNIDLQSFKEDLKAKINDILGAG